MTASIDRDEQLQETESLGSALLPKSPITNFQILLGCSILFGVFVVAEIIGALVSMRNMIRNSCSCQLETVFRRLTLYLFLVMVPPCLSMCLQ